METLDFVFWFRQIVGITVGLTAGLLHQTGVYVIIAFFIVMYVTSSLYTSKVLDVSEEDF